jgi:N-acetylmuramic acid 6-phosphate etherase
MAQNTEKPSALHTDLDQYPTDQLVEAFVSDQLNAVVAVQQAVGDIAEVVNAAVPRIEAGGRLIYVGAGTSGRLGLLDSVELYPTFSWPKDRAVALLAGGADAVYQAIEGAEDSMSQGAADVLSTNPTKNDVLIALAASGTTPYVIGALRAGHERGMMTVGIANNPGSPVVAAAKYGVTLDSGSEIISGSTRLKAGTSQKITLNTISSAIMVRLNKVYGNLMVDVKPTNAKLVRRAIRLTVLATHCDEATAEAILKQCDFHVKTAVVAIRNKTDVAAAKAALEAHRGSVRGALK